MSRIVIAREQLKKEYQARTASTRRISRSIGRRGRADAADSSVRNGEAGAASRSSPRNFVTRHRGRARRRQGLIVPVLKNAETMNLLALRRASRHRETRA